MQHPLKSIALLVFLLQR